MSRTRRKPRGSIFPDGVPTPREAPLTPCELAVLNQLQAGASQPTIAAELGKSVHTIRTVTRNIREKVEARNIGELLYGIRAGIYLIRKKPASKPASFNLDSALAVLEREYRRARDRSLQTVRLHRDEMSAVLGLAQSYSVVVGRSAQISEDLGSVVGRVESLVEEIKGERATLAQAVGRELGAADSERGTLRNAAQIERLGQIFADTPFPLYGDAREKVIDSIRAAYGVGQRNRETGRRRATT